MNGNLSKKYTAFDFILIAILGLFALSIIYPFYNAVLVSLVPMRDYLLSPFMLFPTHVIWDSYKFVFHSRLIWAGFSNSVIIMVAGTAYNMFLTVMCSYALTKPFPGRKFIRLYIIFTMYFSGGVIPYYLLMRSLHLVDTLSVMFIPSGIGILYMIILQNYFQSIPSSLEESAKMDGAGDFTVLLRIILPLSLPLLATFTLYYAVERWNEWYHGMLFIKTPLKLPLQMVLRKIIMDAQFLAQNFVPGTVAKPDTYAESIKMAAIVVTMFPIMMLYPFLQRYFLTGLTLGGVKE